MSTIDPTRGDAARAHPLVGQGDLLRAGDRTTLDAFSTLALVDPITAAAQLAFYFDVVVTHHEGSDDARALDDFARAPNVDDLVFLAGRARGSGWPATIRWAMAAVVVGGLALIDDVREFA